MKESRHSLYRLFFFTLAILITASCAERKRFDGYLYPIHENGLYGYIDSVGNRIIEPAFLWVSTFHNGLAMAVVDTIYLEVPDSMAFEVGEMDTIINVYRMYAKYGYIDRSGEFVIEPKFTSYVNMPNIGFVVKDMDNCSNALYRHSFRNKRAMFYDTTTWKNGYIDTKGDIVIKPIVQRPRPFTYDSGLNMFWGVDLISKKPGNYSFPSGHSCAASAFTTVMLMVKRRAGFIALPFAVLMLFSRLYNYVHFPTDVFAGMILGVLSAVLMVMIFRKTGLKGRPDAKR